jgi:hypothetical protein
MDQSAGRHRFEKLQQLGHEGLQRFDSVGGCNKNDDGHRQGSQILLMLETSVCCQDDIEAVCGQPKQFAVFLPLQPIAATVRTSCPDTNVANGRGNDSSSRTRTGRQHLLGGDFEYSHRLLALHRREVVKELVEGIACRQIVDKVL